MRYGVLGMSLCHDITLCCQPCALIKPVGMNILASCLIVQMYNEEVNDLLMPANRKLAIKEDPEEGVKVGFNDLLTIESRTRGQLRHCRCSVVQCITLTTPPCCAQYLGVNTC